MTGKTATVQIDSQKCSGCGLCIAVCPDQTLSLQGEIAVVSGKKCIQCGHCQAICPMEAISIPVIATPLGFATFKEETSWLPFAAFDMASLVRLMRSRRSCRNYRKKPVNRQMLEDLVKVGITAPSGTNSQGWIFAILDSRDQVVQLGGLIAAFYKRINKMAENPLLRLLAKIFMKDRLGRYYRRYYHSIASGLRQWEEEGKDRLFHGAPAVILVGGRTEASCPVEDALLATQNILLAAHAMGLGTCLIGFAVEAIKNDPSIKSRLSIIADEEIHAVIAVGHPAENYQQVCGRKSVVPRYPVLP